MVTKQSFHVILKSMENRIKIGLIGLGTVGSGVYKTLQDFKNIEITKIAVRNIRRDMVDSLKKIEKEENLPEDAVKDNQDKIQKLTDKYVGIIDAQVVEKEKEVMTV